MLKCSIRGIPRSALLIDSIQLLLWTSAVFHLQNAWYKEPIQDCTTTVRLPEYPIHLSLWALGGQQEVMRSRLPSVVCFRAFLRIGKISFSLLYSRRIYVCHDRYNGAACTIHTCRTGM